MDILAQDLSDAPFQGLPLRGEWRYAGVDRLLSLLRGDGRNDLASGKNDADVFASRAAWIYRCVAERAAERGV